jgi:hypothetical protein
MSIVRPVPGDVEPERLVSGACGAVWWPLQVVATFRFFRRGLSACLAGSYGGRVPSGALDDAAGAGVVPVWRRFLRLSLSCPVCGWRGFGLVSPAVQVLTGAYGRIMERGANERQTSGGHGNEHWGNRMRGGAVTGGAADGHVWVNVSLLGTGMTARLTPEQADDLAGQLRVWAEQARRARRA